MAFSYYRSLTIDRSKCGVSTLSAFPVLVSVSHSTLKDVAHGGHVASGSGYDIVFSTDAQGASKLPWEVESYDNVNGVLVAWVKLATVNGSGAGSNTSFFLCYGDAAISSAQNTGSYASTAVWDANYKGVWHCGNGVILSGADSTANGMNCSIGSTSAAVAGRIGGALSAINYSSNDTLVSPASGLFQNANLTVGAWVVRLTSGLGGTYTALAQGGDTGNRNWYLGEDPTDANFRFSIFNASDSQVSAMSATNWSLNVWHYLVGTYDGSNLRLYVDGVNTATTPTSIVLRQLNLPMTLGGRYLAINSWVGYIDEAKYSNLVRSGDWIVTEYKNQSAPGNIGADNFIMFGTETFNALGRSWGMIQG